MVLAYEDTNFLKTLYQNDEFLAFGSYDSVKLLGNYCQTLLFFLIIMLFTIFV